MLQLNLLPDVKKELLHAKHMRNLVMTICIFVSIGFGIIVFVLGAVRTGLAIQKSILAGEVDANIKIIEKEMTRNQLGEYLSVQNSLGQIDAIKASQPQLSRLMDYLDAIFTVPTQDGSSSSDRLHWTDWRSVKISTVDQSGITIELTGQVDTTMARLKLRNRLYYAMVKYSEYVPGMSGTVKEGETLTDQKLFPNMVPTIDFVGGGQDETTGRWPFKVTLVFNPIAFRANYRIQAIEIDSCKVWSATYGTIGEGCQGKRADIEDELLITEPESKPTEGGNE